MPQQGHYVRGEAIPALPFRSDRALKNDPKLTLGFGAGVFHNGQFAGREDHAGAPACNHPKYHQQDVDLLFGAYLRGPFGNAGEAERLYTTLAKTYVGLRLPYRFAQF